MQNAVKKYFIFFLNLVSSYHLAKYYKNLSGISLDKQTHENHKHLVSWLTNNIEPAIIKFYQRQANLCLKRSDGTALQKILASFSKQFEKSAEYSIISQTFHMSILVYAAVQTKPELALTLLNKKLISIPDASLKWGRAGITFQQIYNKFAMMESAAAKILHGKIGSINPEFVLAKTPSL